MQLRITPKILHLNLVDIVISDVDDSDLTVTLTLSDVAAGTLNTGTSGTVTSTFANGVWTASGTIADVNNLLAALTFTPASDYDSDFTIATSVDDGEAPAVTGVKNFSVTAVDDAPVITDGPDTSSLIETNSGLSDSGTLTVSDSDTTDTVTASVDSVVVAGTGSSSVPAGLNNAAIKDFLTVNPTEILDNTQTSATLTWDFDSGTEAFDFLADGETLVLTYTVRVTDDAGTPLSDTETVTVTITGTNDAPTVTVVDVDGAVIEDAATPNLTDSGSVTFDELDETDVITSSVAIKSTTTTGPAVPTDLATALNSALSINQTGSNDGTIDWDFEVGNSLTQYLAAGETVTVTYTITVTDDSGTGTDSTTQDVTVVITGTNDTPTITVVDVDGAVTEDASTPNLTDSGSVSFAEIDDTDLISSSVAFNGTTTTGPAVPSGLASALNSALTLTQTGSNDGSVAWDFSVDNDLTQYLAAGETVTATYTITVTDDSGTGTDSATQEVTIVITGTNDAPTITNGYTHSLPTTDEDTASAGTLASTILSGANFDDADTNSLSGLAITSTTGNGRWEYSSDGGTTWSAFGPVSSTNALLITSSTEVRYVPDGIDGETATFVFKGWDQTTGTASNSAFASHASTASSGGTTAFSANNSTAEIVVVEVNDIPVIADLDGDSLLYNEGDGPVAIDQSASAVVSDVDSSNFDTGTLTVSFVAGSDVAEDVLSIINTGTNPGEIGISGSDVSYEGTIIGAFTGGSTGSDLVITLNANADETSVSALVQQISYENTDTDNPTTGDRTVRFVLTDGDGGTSANYDTTVSVAGVNDAPVIDLNGPDDGGVNFSTTFNEDDAPVSVTSPQATLTDVDGSTYNQLTIDLGGFVDGGNEKISFAGTVFSYTGTNTQVVTVGSSDFNISLASGTSFVITRDGGGVMPESDLQNLIRSITYENVDDAPVEGNRTFTFTAQDAAGADSLVAVSSINVVGTNDDPVITSAVGGGTHNEGGGGTSFNDSLTITDADEVDFDGGVITVTITNNGEPTDRLTILDGGNVTLVGNSVRYDAGSGPVEVGILSGGNGAADPLKVAFDADADATAVQAVGQRIGFLADSDDPSDLQRTLTMSVTDGDGGTSNTVTRSVTVNAINDNPSDNNAGSFPTDITVTEDVLSDVDLSSIDLQDPDDRGLDITIKLTTSTGGNLFATTGGGVTVAGDATGALTLTGSQDDLNTFLNTTSSIQYQHGTPNTFGDNADTINVVFNDNGNFSTSGAAGVDQNIGTTNVDINAVNDAPVLDLDANNSSGGAGQNYRTSFTEDGGPVLVADSDAILSDVDDTHLSSLTITLGDTPDGTAEALAAEATGTSITATYSSSTGVLLLSGNDTVENYLQVLKTVTYDNSSQNPDTSNRTLTFVANDGDADSNSAVTTIQIFAQNDEEALVVNNGDTVAEGSSNNIITTAMLQTTDVDNTPAELTYTVISLPANGTLFLNDVALSVNDTFTQADIDAGEVTYDHDGTETTSDQFDFTVDDGQGSSTSSQFDIVVTPVNDAPTVTNNGGTVVEGEFTTLTTAMLNASDTDNAATDLLFTVSNVTNGQFETVGNSGVAITSFTQDQIDLGQIIFAHDGSEATTANFDFSLTDGGEDGVAPVTGSFVFTVTPVNDAPESISSTSVGVEDTTLAFQINGADVDGTVDSFRIINLPADGTLFSDAGLTNAVTANSILTADSVGTLNLWFEPTRDFNGTTSFDFSSIDDQGLEDPTAATKTLTLAPVNDAPVAQDDSVNAVEDAGSVSGNVLANDSDVDGDILTINTTPVAGPTSGSLSLSSDGTFTYTPNANFSGTDSFTYEVFDGKGGSAQAIVDIFVSGVNDAPAIRLTDLINSLEENTDTTHSIRVATIEIDDDDLGVNELSLSGEDASKFEIVGNELRIVAGATLDFENDSALDVTVEVNDSTFGATADDSVAYTLNLIDVNESPTVALVNVVQTFPVGTNLNAGVKVADILITDDALGAHTLQLTGEDANQFEIIANELWFKANDSLDLNKISQRVSVSVHDSSIGQTFTESVDYEIQTSQLGIAVVTVTEPTPDPDPEPESEEEIEEETETQDAVDGNAKPTQLQQIVSAPIQNNPLDSDDLGKKQAADDEQQTLLAAANRNGVSDLIVQRASDRLSSFASAEYHAPARRVVSEITFSLPSVNQFTASMTPLVISQSGEFFESNSETSPTLDRVAVGSSALATTSLSVGYVVWMLRGGSLFASFMTSLPAWKSFDLLPILDEFDKESLIDIADLVKFPALRRIICI